MSELQVFRASAGSGKTFNLTRNYLVLLFQDLENYKRILAVTFTNKAAAELKNRVLSELMIIASGDLRRSDHAAFIADNLKMDHGILIQRSKKLVQNILQDYSHYSIGTIDEFFQRILRSFTRELGLFSSYQIELNEIKILNQAVERIIQKVAHDHNLLAWMIEGIQQKIRDGSSWNSFEKDLIDIGRELLRERLLDQSVSFDMDQYQPEKLREIARHLLNDIAEYEAQREQVVDEIKRLLAEFDLAVEDFKGKSRTSWPAYLLKFDNGLLLSSAAKKGEPAEVLFTNKTPSEIQMRINALAENGLNALIDRAIHLNGSPFVTYSTQKIVYGNLYAIGLAGQMLTEIAEISREGKTILLSQTSGLINQVIGDNPSPFIFEKTGTYLKHYMIDEFQDTSEIQWANFLPLIRNSLSEGGKAILVGDIKQSIYRWRNSNWQLMASKAEEDLKEFNTKYHSLRKNFRSRDQIIDFNNIFFGKAIEALIDRIAYQDGTHADQLLTDEDLRKVYEDIKQENGSGEKGGFVRIEMIENQTDTVDTNYLNKLPALVEELQLEKGYSATDIVFLVRRNKEAIAVIDTFNRYVNSGMSRKGVSYSMVSPDSFLMDAAPEIRIIVHAMQAIIEPDKQFHKAKLAFEYCVLKDDGFSDHSFKLISRLSKEDLVFNSIMPELFVNLIESQTNKSCGLLIDDIIHVLGLSKRKGSVPYLFSLKDYVREAGLTSSFIIEDFLKWWEEEGKRLAVKMDETADSMRIMTIHKAKGLEFPVVILPKCDWSLDHSATKRPLLWVKGNQAGIDVPGLLVRYQTGLLNTVYDSEYLNERIQVHLDNLNLLYVAFTRAEDRLYAFCPINRSSKKSMSGLIYETVLGSSDELVYSFGDEDTIKYQKHRSDDRTLDKLDDYQLDGITKRKEISLSYSSQEIDRGKLYHNILSQIDSVKDLEGVLGQMKKMGRIDDEQFSVILQEIENLLLNEQIAPWFQEGLDIKKEAGILVPGVGEIRPDRVVIDQDQAIIIEFKTGMPRQQDVAQVRKYREALIDLGYEKVNGYILYLVGNEIVSVN